MKFHPFLLNTVNVNGQELSLCETPIGVYGLKYVTWTSNDIVVCSKQASIKF